MKKFKVYLIFFLCLVYQNTLASKIEIKLKVDNEIITNQDIVDEANYLISMNKSLNQISKKDIYKISIQSLIKEKIKYLEVIKYYDVNSENEKLNELVLSNLLSQYRVNNKQDLEKLFSKLKLNMDEVNTKIKIEVFWKKLIFDKYISKVSINKTKLKEKVTKQSNSNYSEEFFLREILFELNNNKNVNDEYLKIKETINNNTFATAASIFSISDTSLQGGEIGWIRKSQLSEKLINHVINLEIGEISKPIQLGNKYLILKLEDKRKKQIKIDIDKELEIIVQKETDRQLNQYSANYFNKIKKNIYINEL